MTGKFTVSKDIKMAHGTIMNQFSIMGTKHHRYLMTGSMMRSGRAIGKKLTSRSSTPTFLINQLGKTRAHKESDRSFRASLIIAAAVRRH